AHVLLEVGGENATGQAARALQWLKPRQVLDQAGDWAMTRPGVRPGGWPFQYNNPIYPDLDDTAVAAMAMDRGGAKLAAGDRGDVPRGDRTGMRVGDWDAEQKRRLCCIRRRQYL